MINKSFKCLILMFLISCTINNSVSASPQTVSSFEECVAAGNPVRKSLPAQCVAKDGKVYVDQKTLKVPQVSEGAAAGEKFCKDLCGDGQCQEIVCMAQGCPCPESKANCPKDCK